jgi:hypothetical protein
MHTAYWSSLEPRLHQHTHTLIFLDHNIFFYSKIDQPPTLIQNPLAGNITLQQQARSPCTQVWHQYLPVMDTACYNSTIIHPLISYFILLSLPFCPNPHFLPNDLFNSYFFFTVLSLCLMHINHGHSAGQFIHFTLYLSLVSVHLPLSTAPEPLGTRPTGYSLSSHLVHAHYKEIVNGFSELRTSTLSLTLLSTFRPPSNASAVCPNCRNCPPSPSFNSSKCL